MHEILWAWAQPFLPTPQMVAVGVPLTGLYAAAAASFAGWLRIQKEVRTPYTRKVFHFIIISAAALVQLVWGLPGVTVFGSTVAVVVLYAVFCGDDFPFYEAMARPTDEPHRSLFIVIPLLTTALGGVLSNLLFTPFAPVGYMVMGWGDATGEPVGTRWGKHRYQVPSLAGVPATRSLEGSSAVFLTGSLAAVAVLLWMGYPTGTATVVGFLCGAGGAGVESFSSHGLDNLTVPLAAAGIAYLIL